jgi:hypothetical protein
MRTSQSAKFIGGLAIIGALSIAPLGYAQEGQERNYGGDRISRIESGTNIPVRVNETIDVERRDNRVYTGIVDRDVRGVDRRLAIPRGSTVELIVRVMRDNDLVLDLESVNLNGRRYGIRTDATHLESQRDNSLLGNIVGAISGGQVQGRAVRIPRDSVLSFRIQTPLNVDVPDRGIERNGSHYHDYYRDNDYYRR